jgi:NADH-quinone oxidoreductase subunit E
MPAVEQDGGTGQGEPLDLSAVAQIVADRCQSDADLIPILQQIQAHYGYLPEVVVAEIARLSGIPASRIFGVITFYAQFTTLPRGRHTVCVCQGTACHVRGAHDVLRSVEKALSLVPGETTADLDFSLETVACLGACSFAPVMTVDGQYFAKMRGSRVPAVLAEFETNGGDDGDE